MSRRLRGLLIVGVLCLCAPSLPGAPPATPQALPPELLGEFEWIEDEYRKILTGPIEGWKLKPIRERYEKLLGRVSDSKARDRLQSRIAQVESREEMASSASILNDVLAKSRRRDHEVDLAKRILASANRPLRSPFTARGLLQASSRQVDGRRVYALIGTEGRPIAYLDVPAGMDARPVVSKQVGVRGSVHYDERLGSKVIDVRDFETLE